MSTLEKYKHINLPLFVENYYGFTRDKGYCDSYPKFNALDQNGHKLFTILCKKNSNGRWQWGDLSNDDFKGYTIIDLVQRIEKINTGKNINIGHVRHILDTYLKNNNISIKKDININVNSNNNIKKSLGSYNTFIKNVKPLKDYSFLKSRGLSDNILHHPYFKDILYQHTYIDKPSGKTYHNTCYPMYNAKGEQVAFAVRNDGFGGTHGDKSEAIAISRPYKDKAIDSLFVCETMDDAMSYYQLHADQLSGKNILFAASQGSLSSSQVKPIDQLIKKNNIQNIQLGFDRDSAGYMYSLRLIANLQSFTHEEANKYQFTINKTRSQATLTIRVGSIGFNDPMQDIFNINTLFTEARGIKPGSYAIEMVDNEYNYATTAISFEARDKTLWTKAIDIISKVRGIKNHQLVFSNAKDWNEDLKKNKNNLDKNKNELTIL